MEEITEKENKDDEKGIKTEN